MIERIKITIYWILGAVALIVVPYKYAFFLENFFGDKHKEPIFLTWFVGVFALAISIVIICGASYGFYKWMHWFLGNNKNDKK